ncbi:claudin-1 [Tachysurus vachellii]|uniref:claudin-1 n=1 Tax=Tachysurus vachellii TaxID=175792 RepID=UPI00296A9570|nr:claudin-1 [Tachysurus vachellii]XP_060731159.1 claudin-1 [Tachysurus vachellii]XP_060731160.1 claudin-1 [Tachysurus vachellii]
MASGGMQLLGYILAFLGFVGLIISTTMTEWKMSSYAGDNIITAQAVYEGLWQSCVYQSTGQIQCKVYDSLLQLPLEVQAARGFMVSGILLCGIAILVAAVGMKCTKCMEDNMEVKSKVAMAGGVIFVVAGVCAFIATIWYGDNIRRQFFNPFTPTNARYEFGKALYIGWGSCSLTVIGGSLLCCNCGTKSSGGPAKRYPGPRPK